mgnify:CR=1 FL=1
MERELGIFSSPRASIWEERCRDMSTRTSLRSSTFQSLYGGGGAWNFSKCQKLYRGPETIWGESLEFFQIPKPTQRFSSPRVYIVGGFPSDSSYYVPHIPSFLLPTYFPDISSYSFILFSTYFLTKSHRRGRGGGRGLLANLQ